MNQTQILLNEELTREDCILATKIQENVRIQFFLTLSFLGIYKLIFLTDNKRTSSRRKKFNPIRYGFGNKIKRSSKHIDIKNDSIIIKIISVFKIILTQIPYCVNNPASKVSLIYINIQSRN